MDLYVILGVARGATGGDIKRAYKRLARKYHPDINPGDRTAATQFRRIAEAYETLSDPDRRRVYDTTGSMHAQSIDATFEFDGFDFSVSAESAEAPTFGDLFAEVFRQRAADTGQGVPERGADLHQTITVGFEEALRGGEYIVAVTRQEPCRTCEGRGWLAVMETRCGYCRIRCSGAKAMICT